MSLPLTRLEQLSYEIGGHESFPFRYGWLKKAADVIQEDEDIFQKDEAIARLGVGKNMVRSIRHWALATGVLEEVSESSSARRKRLRVSELGVQLLDDKGWDPFLEDLASLWLIHWCLFSNKAKATTWYLAFSLLHKPVFTREQVQDLVSENLMIKGFSRSPNTIERDVNCFIQTYNSSFSTDLLTGRRKCPLTELRLISTVGDRLYRFGIGPKSSLPSEIVGYALMKYYENLLGTRGRTLSIEDCQWGEGSPGQAFKLDEESFIAHLIVLEQITEGALRFDDTAGLKQLYIQEDIESIWFLRRYYEGNG